ncbi:hypothetical protein OG462_33010 [Streptomyces sp. NBC_01077]|nr:hypothetical protein OG462_33010 [Streptomyces sp. NBC_01077]
MRCRSAAAVSSARARYDVILASPSGRWRLRARHRRPVSLPPSV